jgi:hypothetical protein
VRRIDKPCLASCLEAGRHGELIGSRKSIPVGERSLYFRRSIRNFACHTGTVPLCVKRFCLADGGLSGLQPLPQGVNPPPKGADRTNAGDDNTQG